MKFGVCLDTVFLDHPLPDRVRRIKEIGYDAVEFWFHNYAFTAQGLIPQRRNLDGLKNALNQTGLTCTDFVWISPDGAIDGATLINSEDFPRAMARLDQVISIAQNLGCRNIIACTGNAQKGKNVKEQTESIIASLTAVLPKVKSHDLTILIEPLNTRVDHPGYFLSTSDLCAEIIYEINSPNVKMLYDIYHMQIMEGNIISHIERHIDIIGHFHAAGVPGRHELYTGELNYKNIIKSIEELGYQGAFGMEYFPTFDDTESLKKVLDECTA